MELTNWGSREATEPVGEFWLWIQPRQLVGLQDVLCLVVDEAISLAYFVFSLASIR